MSKNISNDAQKAIQMIDELEKAGAGNKYQSAKSFIKKRGIVQKSFLQRLQKEYNKIITEDM